MNYFYFVSRKTEILSYENKPQQTMVLFTLLIGEVDAAAEGWGVCRLKKTVTATPRGLDHFK